MMQMDIRSRTKNPTPPNNFRLCNPCLQTSMHLWVKLHWTDSQKFTNPNQRTQLIKTCFCPPPRNTSCLQPCQKRNFLPLGVGLPFLTDDFMFVHLKWGSVTYGPLSKIIRPAALYQIVATARPA